MGPWSDGVPVAEALVTDRPAGRSAPVGKVVPHALSPESVRTPAPAPRGRVSRIPAERHRSPMNALSCRLGSRSRVGTTTPGDGAD